MKSLLKIYEIFNMYILFGTATKLHHNLPHSGLGPFDAFKTAELFELEDRKTENCFTIWSDHIRHGASAPTSQSQPEETPEEKTNHLSYS